MNKPNEFCDHLIHFQLASLAQALDASIVHQPLLECEESLRDQKIFGSDLDRCLFENKAFVRTRVHSKPIV